MDATSATHVVIGKCWILVWEYPTLGLHRKMEVSF